MVRAGNGFGRAWRWHGNCDRVCPRRKQLESVDHSPKYDGPVLAETTGYVLGTNPAEQRRLQQQSLDFAEQSAWLLDQAGIQPGWRVIDIGCGPRGVLELMAARVGPSGRVVGLEQNAEHAALAEAFARAKGLETVTIMQGDVLGNDLPKSSFALAHERTVLVNVPDPEAALRAMVELVRPGGVVVCQDPDQSARVCDPPHPAWDRLTELLFKAWRRHGADPCLGRRLPGMVRRAGLESVGVNLYAVETGIDHPRRFTFLTFIDNLREAIVVGGLCRAEELDQDVRALRAHLEDPETTVVSSLFYQVWGRKPD